MVKESQHHDFRQKNIDKTKFFDEIQHNNLITGKHKNVYRNLNHFENFHFFLFLMSVVVIGIPVRISSSPGGIKLFEVTEEIKNFKSIIIKK